MNTGENQKVHLISDILSFYYIPNRQTTNFFIFAENHPFSQFLLTKALGRKSTIFKDFQGFWDFQGFSMIFIEYPYFHLENYFFSQVGVIS